jgi:hypothetical protein
MIEQRPASAARICTYVEGMKDENQNPVLFGVVADICELLGNVIALAPSEQRDELCRFALMEVAAITDVSDRKTKQH